MYMHASEHNIVLLTYILVHARAHMTNETRLVVHMLPTSVQSTDGKQLCDYTISGHGVYNASRAQNETIDPFNFDNCPQNERKTLQSNSNLRGFIASAPVSPNEPIF